MSYLPVLQVVPEALEFRESQRASVVQVAHGHQAATNTGAEWVALHVYKNNTDP